jgi:hypothetical protein
MITICVLFAAKGSVKTKLKMALACMVIDAIYIIPCFI